MLTLLVPLIPKLQKVMASWASSMGREECAEHFKGGNRHDAVDFAERGEICSPERGVSSGRSHDS